VELALKGRNSVMPAIKRVSQSPYKWKIEVAELKDVATWRNSCRATTSAKTASASPRSARRYLSPLILGEDYPPYDNGLPKYVRLKNVAVPKKLGDFKLS